MNNNLTIYGEVLEANKEERTISGLLMPWDEVGYTSAGAIQASKGTVEIPQDIGSVKLNLEHVATSPVGTATALTEKADGLHATFRIANTTAGNDLLEEVKEGLRSALSIEISKPVIKAGSLLSGLITGSAAVVSPAFKSARISTLTASDTGEQEEEAEQLPETDKTNSKEFIMEETTSEKVEATEVVSTPVQAEPIFAAESHKAELGKLTFDAYNAGGAPAINAALADQLTTHDAGQVYIKDQDLGSLFEARKVERKLVNAVGVKPLTSLFVTGTKKNRTFEVADWAGNKTEIPTGTFTTERVNWEPKAKAVGVDVAAELVEFGGEGVLSDLYEQAIDSYIEQTETELLSYISSESAAVSAAFSPVAAIDKASELLGNIGANMSFIAVSPDVMAALRSIKTADAPWWLAGQGAVDLRNRSIDLGGVVLTSNQDLPAKTVLVGDARAIDYRESRDIKFRALDIQNGGVDISLIKFLAKKVTDNGAILKFTNVSASTAA